MSVSAPDYLTISLHAAIEYALNHVAVPGENDCDGVNIGYLGGDGSINTLLQATPLTPVMYELVYYPNNQSDMINKGNFTTAKGMIDAVDPDKAAYVELTVGDQPHYLWVRPTEQAISALYSIKSKRIRRRRGHLY